MTVRPLVAFLVLVAAAAAPAGRARADAPPAAVKNEAKQRFALGVSLFEKGDNAAALAEFKRAYELIPNPLVLYNLGLVYAAMNRPVEAVDALDRFLGSGSSAVAGEPARRARQVRAEQVTRIAELQVETNKPATIEIDGVEAGHTPLASPLRIISGSHVVSAEAPGCLPSHQEINVPGQITTTIKLALLPTESNVAHLALTVSVPGAEVLVNGKSAGTTPLAASVAVPPGAATIEVRRAGYRPLSRSLRLDEGSSGALELALEEDLAASPSLRGQLRLEVAPRGAVISVDGVTRPLSPAGLTVPGGPHTLRVQRAGFVTYERQVDVPAGRETALAIDLAPTAETRQRQEDAARSRRIWGWSAVAVGLGVAAGSVAYLVSSKNDISQAQSTLDAYLMRERDPNDHCWADPMNSGTYMAFQCGATKISDQDQLDSARFHRVLGYSAIGLGAAIAGLGAFMLAAGDPPDRYAQSSALHLTLASDGRGATVGAALRF
jgi:hypothetical protein